MSDFDMYILPLLCNQNENYYCWSSMIMSSYFNVLSGNARRDEARTQMQETGEYLFVK